MRDADQQDGSALLHASGPPRSPLLWTSWSASPYDRRCSFCCCCHPRGRQHRPSIAPACGGRREGGNGCWARRRGCARGAGDVPDCGVPAGRACTDRAGAAAPVPSAAAVGDFCGAGRGGATTPGSGWRAVRRHPGSVTLGRCKPGNGLVLSYTRDPSLPLVFEVGRGGGRVLRPPPHARDECP